MTSTVDELKFYCTLARNLFRPGYDLHKIPGPPGYWGLGHIPKIMRPDYHVQMLEWADQYGGIFKFSLGCQWVVVVSDPAVATQVLGRGADSVPRKCVGYQFFDLATNHLGRRSFFTTPDEQQWAGVRKAAAAAFNMANVRRSFPNVLKHATVIADEMATRSAAASSDASRAPVSRTSSHSASSTASSTAAGGKHGGPAQEQHDGSIDIQEHLELALLHVFVEALFDVPAEEFPGHDVAEAMNLVLEEANERLKVPLRGLATYVTRPKWYASVRRAQKVLGDAYGQLADIVRSRGEPADSNNNLWACLARVKDPKTGKPLSREQLIPEIGAFMMAGFDTSSHTIAWVLYALATHPEHQRKVHEELDSKGLLHGPGRDPRELSMDDLSQLPHLNCVIDETMRMYPVAATASVREVVKPVKVGPYTIPQGVIVWPMLYALHNAAHNWDSPREFQPERWADKHYAALARTTGTPNSPASSTDGSDSERPSAESRTGSGRGLKQQSSGSKAGRAFLPFSDGIKNCLGQNLGLMEVRTVLVALLSRFRFELHPGMGGAEQVERNMIMSLTLKMKGGLRVVCHPLEREVDYLAAPTKSLAQAAALDTPPSSPTSPSTFTSSSATDTTASPEEAAQHVHLLHDDQEPDMLMVTATNVPELRRASLAAQLLHQHAPSSMHDSDEDHALKKLKAQQQHQMLAPAGAEVTDEEDAAAAAAVAKHLSQRQQQLQQQEVQGGWEDGWLSAVKAQARRLTRGGAVMQQEDDDLQVD